MDRIQRPPSVWITIIVILLFLVPFLVGGVSPIARCLLSGASRCPSLEILLRAVVVFGGIVTITSFTFWGLLRRKSYGKWLGVMLLAMLLGLMIMSEQSRIIYGYILSGGQRRNAMPAGYYEFSNVFQLLGAAAFTVLLHLSFLFLIFRLAFGRSARRYFQSGKLVGLMREPDDAPTPSNSGGAKCL